ncbi:GIY-YIG nuclease family protein [Halothiobacillus sp.]|uniref:GIY-YIG nuclease family protein n=1 Tax=Halothiobacillus sp. TaxID=1891311 RepID=UPI00260C6DBF|nr:GIY-YIG nuclease family protein [Halothiobacillus sp.]
MDDDELLEALGIDITPVKSATHTPREERIIAGFEDILRFWQTQGRIPQHGNDKDIFERMYAVRLEQIRKLPEAATLLAELDTPGLLAGTAQTINPAELDEDSLLAELGVDAKDSEENSITVLKYVRSVAEKRAAEEIADRNPCKDFEQYKARFQQAEQELHSGIRKAVRFGKDTSIQVGNFFIVGGQIALVAEMGEDFTAPNGESDARMRVIYANGTESNLLRRSLQRALYKDENGRRLTDTDLGPLFASEVEPEDIESGTIYVLRSLSTHPFITEHRELIHKIGVTGGKVETRISGAEHDPTYLMAGVEIVATWKLHNINRTKLEHLFHRLFAAAQIDISIEDRFGQEVKPREWFLVPLQVIDEAVNLITNNELENTVFNPETARIESTNK